MKIVRIIFNIFFHQNLSMEINGVTTPVTGVDTMWRHPLGACDSTVQKITDDTGVEWVEISRTLSLRVKNKHFF